MAMSHRLLENRGVVLVCALAVGGAWLAWPSDPSEFPRPEEETAFRWDADQLFATLESEFAQARTIELGEAAAAVADLETEGGILLAGISDREDVPFDLLERLTTLQFELAVRAAAHPSLLPRVQEFSLATRGTRFPRPASSRRFRRDSLPRGGRQ